MKNSLVRFQGQVVKVNVSNNIIEMITENDEKLVFEANKNNFSIDYNVGNLGSAVCFDENGKPYYPNQLACKFENGNTYSISELDYCTSVKGKTFVVHDKIFHEVFIQLSDGEDDFTYCDILLQSDNITARINGQILQAKEHRVFAGYYTRYDGFPFLVVDVIPNLETNEKLVICKRQRHKKHDDPYFALSYEEFCKEVEVDGEIVKKYCRMTGHEKLHQQVIEMLIEDGYRAPIRHIKKIDVIRERRQSKTYLAYAKDLCNWFKEDYERYMCCKENKSRIGVTKKEFQILVEDLSFIQTCLKTTLSDYKNYFLERFKEKKSIRQYAKEHNLNRGSVDYIQKKLITALAKALEERDKSDGIKRLLDPNSTEFNFDDC